MHFGWMDGGKVWRLGGSVGIERGGDKQLGMREILGCTLGGGSNRWLKDT